MRLEFQESIDRYLLNRMSDEERTLFEAKCAETPELQEQLEHTRDVRTVITERNKILARIQELDEEYDKEKRIAARKKTVLTYWISGIAALFVVGYFLFPSKYFYEMGSPEDLVSLNQENDRRNLAENQADDIAYDSKEQLAQNEVGKKDQKPKKSQAEEQRELSFGNESLEPSRTPNTGVKQELREIDEEKSVIAENIIRLDLQLKSGEISQTAYNSIIDSLYVQRDWLRWKEVMSLIRCNRKDKALPILDEMRSVEGQYQRKADSLYHELIQ